jgi:IMP dehydrogenase
MNSKNGLPPMVSFGLGSNELERAMALVDAGATHLILDVANGAQINVVKQFNILADKYGSNVGLIVGNFATNKSINTFNDYVKQRPIAYKVGIGGGSACTTRVKTGIGVPTLSSVMDCSQRGNRPVIADGGMKTAGDVAKALGAGAQMVMLGGMLAGTYQTPGEIVTDDHKFMAMSSSHVSKKFKKYRGSASQESYEAQGKSDTHRTAEGESFLVPLKGSVVDVLQDIEGGLRSSMTYTNSLTLSDFRKNCTFIEVSSNTTKENGAHGRSS